MTTRRAPAPERGGARRPRADGTRLSVRCLLPLLVVAVVGAIATPADAQEGPEPEMAAAPAQFRAGATGGVVGWPEGADRTPDDAVLWGLDLERLLLSAVSIRFGAAYGTTTLLATDDAVEADAYLLELSGVVRGAFAPLERIGVIPFATLGAGSLVHDPDRDGLPTASQNALSWGAGVEIRPLTRRGGSLFAPLGLRAEWRRYQVELENVFDPVDRTGRTRHANRFFASLFWSF